jgi:O-antigen/teichoic acid export membrane protein
VSDHAVSEAVVTEVRRSTRAGAIGLIGAVVSGVFGFVLTVVVVRTYGAAGSGALFSVIGLVTIAGAVCCLGADTALLWAVPRRRSAGDAARLLPVALVPTVAVALLVAVAGWYAAAPIARVLLDDPGGVPLVRLAFAGVPVLVASTVLLAAVRAARPIGAYVAVQSVFVPIARPALIGGTVLLGGGVLAGFAGWLLPLLAAGVLAALLIVRPFGLTSGAVLRPTAADRRAFWGFALPRAASVAIDAGSMWIGVLLTAALAGPTQAGVFAAVGRYALAGLLVMHGLRVAVGPQLSRLLGAGRIAEAAAVHRRTTRWIVLLSWSAYLLMAVFAPGFLELFGPEFVAGAGALALLAGAMAVNAGVGLAQTVLLMSGNSRGHLCATVAGLTLTVVAGCALIPHHGALGAAAAWSIGIVTENALAAVMARRVLGQPPADRGILVAGAAVLFGVGTPCSVGVAVAGEGLVGLAVAVAVLAAVVLLLLGDARVRAALHDVREQVRR